ncbi:MAG: peptidoglycan DD-metalloendopeptidase family protein [Actinomycetota bacterium]|nr:peptidoglycan DD-metalloendopeptidase family protein [Actinomycetota bacterium]
MKKRIRYSFFLLAILFLLISTGERAIGETESIREAREKKQDASNRRADAAAVLKLAEADDQAVVQALYDLDAAVAMEQSKIEAARQAIEAAEAEATLRWVETDQVVKGIEDLRRRLRDLAVDVYVSSMNPGTFFESDDMSSAVRKSAILSAVSGDQGDLVDQLRALEADKEEIARSADQAIRDAERNQLEIEAGLLVLDSRIAERETARDEVQERIELAEAEIAEWKREQYLMAILIDNLIAEELRKSAPDLTKESGQGFILPIDKSSKITSAFGMRTHPILGVKRMHNGVDFGCVRDQPIWAAKSAKVVFAGTRGYYGKTVILEHEGPVLTLYAHLNEILVSNDMQVSTGDLIGKCGTTGRSTGNHLHFEVRTGGEAKDPMIVLPKN